MGYTRKIGKEEVLLKAIRTMNGLTNSSLLQKTKTHLTFKVRANAAMVKTNFNQAGGEEIEAVKDSIVEEVEVAEEVSLATTIATPQAASELNINNPKVFSVEVNNSNNKSQTKPVYTI